VYADPADVLADIEALAPMHEAVFDRMRIVPILRLVQSVEERPTALSAKQQRKLLAALGEAAMLCGGYKITRAGEPALAWSEGSVDEFKIEIAGTPFLLAEMGVFG